MEKTRVLTGEMMMKQDFVIKYNTGGEVWGVADTIK